MTDFVTDLQPVQMPVLALRGLVLFPQNILHFDVSREKSVQALEYAAKHGRKIFLVTQQDAMAEEVSFENLYRVGVVAEVQQIVKGRGNKMRVMVEGCYRAVIEEQLGEEPFLCARVVELPLRGLTRTITEKTDALMRTVKDLFERHVALVPKMSPELLPNALLTDDPVYLVEYIAGTILARYQQKQALLNEDSVNKRLQLLATLLESENNVLQLEKELYEKVKEQMDRNQRDYYLREQQRAIAEELGEADYGPDEVQEYADKIAALGLTGEVAEKLQEELRRFARMPGSSQEATVIRNYLDVCLELPWNKATVDKIDLHKAAKLLDREHYGMKKVKERILELLAVRKLAPDIKGQIICLVGPPGVGKTSIARSIAQAMGRNYTRMSLGGVRDEAEIRGHRKTYIGAMPGRIITAIKQAGSNNPLLLLDEIDKLAGDFRGDPAAALLEVLDSEQNFAFRDHYLEVPFDLSNVLFIATANSLDGIPGPLRDRMEIIELASYTREEKFQIAKRHLLKKQTARHGLTAQNFAVRDSALYAIVDGYTREAGVRGLERQLGALARKAARQIVAQECEKVVVTDKNIEQFLGPRRFLPDDISLRDEVGVVNGLAWTSVGGEMLKVEVAVLEGSGKIQLTGSLGDVMKESAQAAISYVRSVCGQYGIASDFYKTRDIHIHVPEGAVPKDGPSAGVTIATAIVSALTAIPVRGNVAMTGEVTLRGRVLPIGGLREKAMAAYRNGMKTVLVPKQNLSDLQEVDGVVREHLAFVPAEEMATVLETALSRPAGVRAAAPKAFEVVLPGAGDAPQPEVCQ